MKVLITKVEKTKVEVDVDLPFFRKHLCDHGTYFYCINGVDGNFSQASIYRSDRGEFDLELTTMASLGGSDDTDYILGREEYSCTEEEFFKVVSEMREKLDYVVAMFRGTGGVRNEVSPGRGV